jgi:hypothetical protein
VPVIPAQVFPAQVGGSPYAAYRHLLACGPELRNGSGNLSS